MSSSGSKVAAFIVFVAIGAIAVVALLLFSGEKFRVGVLAPFTGAGAPYASAVKAGIEIAKEKHPELFENVEFYFEDSQWEKKPAVAAYEKLRAVQKVNLMFSWGIQASEFLTSLSEQNQLPLLVYTPDSQALRGAKFAFRAVNSASDFGLALSSYIRRANYRNVAIIIADDKHVDDLFRGLQAAVGQDVKLEVVGRYPADSNNFDSAVTKLLEGSYDALGIYLLPGQISKLYQELIAKKVVLPTFGTPYYENTDEIHSAGGGMNGAVFSNLNASPEFQSEYARKTPNASHVAVAAHAHDIALMIGSLFGKSRTKVDGATIMERLRSVQNFAGATGGFSFRETSADGPHFHFPVVVKRIDADTVSVLP